MSGSCWGRGERKQVGQYKHTDDLSSDSDEGREAVSENTTR